MVPGISAGEESEMSTNVTESVKVDRAEGNISIEEDKAPANSASTSVSNHGSGSSIVQGEEPVSTREGLVADLYPRKADKRTKSSAYTNNLSGKKKKGKVDWTHELHKQFVQAVEQLGLDKAVPSKILELMGVDCLTRHNVASHLQKYRSHRKHVLAREVEAATWSRKRQLYTTKHSADKSDPNSWVVPTTGFPQVTSVSRSRPFHVWGHPLPNQSFYMWPNHLASSPSRPAWASGHPPPLGDPSFWNCHQDVPAQGMPCYPSNFQQPTFATPPVQGLPPSSMYGAAPSIGVPVTATGTKMVKPVLDNHLSKESIDAAIGDVLSKPWLPLPLGLKPPSTDSVVVELQRQGISKVPPTCA